MSKVNQPLVSVIVPCYNHEKYVEQTIDSIVNQTYKNIELIVIDDGSKDSSPEILEKLSKKYNFYFERQENMGLPATLNKMIKMAQGKYISLIASDDVKTLDKIEILVKEFESLSDQYAVVFGDAGFIDTIGERRYLMINNEQIDTFINKYFVQRNDLNSIEDLGTYSTLLVGNYLPAMTTLIRTEVLVSVNLFDENITIEDWSMWLKLARKYKFKFVNKIVGYYRTHETNTSITMREELNLDMLKVYDREKEYCYDNNFNEIWEKQYYGKLLNIIREKKIITFIKNIEVRNLYGLYVYVQQKIVFNFLKSLKNES